MSSGAGVLPSTLEIWKSELSCFGWLCSFRVSGCSWDFGSKTFTVDPPEITEICTVKNVKKRCIDAMHIISKYNLHVCMLHIYIIYYIHSVYIYISSVETNIANEPTPPFGVFPIGLLVESSVLSSKNPEESRCSPRQSRSAGAKNHAVDTTNPSQKSQHRTIFFSRGKSPATQPPVMYLKTLKIMGIFTISTGEPDFWTINHIFMGKFPQIHHTFAIFPWFDPLQYGWHLMTPAYPN